MKASTLARRLFHGTILGAILAALVLGGLLPAHAGITDKDNDFNNDGNSDIIAIDVSDDCLYRWNGNGSGGILAGSQLGCGWGDYLDSLTMPGDINSNGNSDLVGIDRSDPNGCMYRWLGTGAGTFGSGAQLSCGWNPYVGTITGAGDLDGDNDGDLVGINRTTGCMYRWLGTGSGTFFGGVLLGCGWDAYRFSLAAPGDINSDGDADLVAINASTGCLFRWLGDGAGGLGSGTQLGCGWDNYVSQLSGMGDLNGDGDGDLVGYNPSDGCLWRWTGTGSGAFNAGATLGCSGWNDKYLAR